jgi:hypothetical protein
MTEARVVAVAGRRIDAVDATTPAFPISALPVVRARLAQSLSEAARVVSSAACGTDLLALEIAKGMGLPRRIILPFDPAVFRETSVVDRPGPWGDVYDEQISDAVATGDLIVLPGVPGDDAYRRATDRILEEAKVLAGAQTPIALVAWDQRVRKESDASADFLEKARVLKFSIRTVSTLP